MEQMATSTAVYLLEAGFSFSMGMMLPFMFLLTLSAFLSEPARCLGEWITKKLLQKRL